MVLAVALIVVGGTPEVRADDDDDLSVEAHRLRLVEQIVHAAEQQRERARLLVVVIRVRVEPSEREVGAHGDAVDRFGPVDPR